MKNYLNDLLYEGERQKCGDDGDRFRRKVGRETENYFKVEIYLR